MFWWGNAAEYLHSPETKFHTARFLTSCAILETHLSEILGTINIIQVYYNMTIIYKKENLL